MEGVSATGGQIAITVASPLTVNEAVANTGGGNVTLGASDQIFQNANVSTTGAGGITVTATSGITMANGVNTTSDTGAITYTAGGTMALGSLATGGGITVTSTGGSILDGTATPAVNVAARTVATLRAGGGTIGTDAEALDVSVIGPANVDATGVLGGVSININGTAGGNTLNFPATVPGQVLFNGVPLNPPPSPVGPSLVDSEAEISALTVLQEAVRAANQPVAAGVFPPAELFRVEGGGLRLPAGLIAEPE
jgi:hypothetical protein